MLFDQAQNLAGQNASANRTLRAIFEVHGLDPELNRMTAFRTCNRANERAKVPPGGSLRCLRNGLLGNSGSLCDLHI